MLFLVHLATDESCDFVAEIVIRHCSHKQLNNFSKSDLVTDLTDWYKASVYT